MNHGYEIKRRKALENFLKKKKMRRAEDFEELILNTKIDASDVRKELNLLAF
jgi:hypothetical protein